MNNPLLLNRKIDLFQPWSDRLITGLTTGTRLNGENASLAFLPQLLKEETLKAREDFCSQLGIGLDQFCCLNQCHSTRVIKAENPGLGSLSQESTEEADSLISSTPGLCLSVFSADCVPLLIYDPRKHAAAATHGGWKGTLGKIAGKTVVSMENEWDCKPEDLRVYIGPAIGSCCYQIGDEVAQLFEKTFHFHQKILRRERKSYFLDLKETHKRVLISAGVPENQIEVSPECTLCGENPFPSYRKSGASAGRFSAFILLK